jgi:hypothetical protein
LPRGRLENSFAISLGKKADSHHRDTDSPRKQARKKGILSVSRCLCGEGLIEDQQD